MLALRQTNQLRLEELRGIFWPQEVYRRVKKTAAPKSMSLVDLDYQGKRLKGYMLDESHGRPVGTIAVMTEDTRFTTKARMPKLIMDNVTRLHCN